MFEPEEQRSERILRHTDDVSIDATIEDTTMEFFVYAIIRHHKVLGANGEVVSHMRYYQHRESEDEETTELSDAAIWMLGTIWDDGGIVWSTREDEHLHLRNIKELKVGTQVMLDCYAWAVEQLENLPEPTP